MNDQSQQNIQPNAFLPPTQIKIFQPKLLQMKALENDRKVVPNLTSEYQKENKKLKNKINELNEMEKQIKDEQHNMELQRNLKSFYRNPFSYMDYLVKQYFKEKANMLENLQIKDQITKEFSSFCHEIESKLGSFTRGEISRIKALERKIDDKLNMGGNGTMYSDQAFLSKPMGDNKALNDFFTIPNTAQQANNNLDPNDIDSNKRQRLLEILTRPDSSQMILNDKLSDLHQEEIFKHTLACLKGDTISPPKQEFLSCDNITLEDIQKQEMRDAKRITDLKKKAGWEEYIHAQLDPKHSYVDDPIEARAKNQKSQEKVLYNKVINQSTKAINKMNNASKDNEVVLDYVKNKLDENFRKETIKTGLTRLSLYETNLNAIKKDLNKAEVNQYCVDLNERLKIIEKDDSKTNNKIANVMGEQVYSGHHQLEDDDIDKLYKKYKQDKGKGKGKQKSKVYSRPKSKQKHYHPNKNIKYY